MPISLARYAGIFILMMVVMFVLSIAMEEFAGISMPSGVSAILPPMIAAMMEGQRVAKAENRAFAGDEKWQAAWKMTGVAVVINAITAGFLMAFTDIGQLFATAGASVITGVVAFLLVVTLLVNRMFLGTGVNQIEKAAKKDEPS